MVISSVNGIFHFLMDYVIFTRDLPQDVKQLPAKSTRMPFLITRSLDHDQKGFNAL